MSFAFVSDYSELLKAPMALVTFELPNGYKVRIEAARGNSDMIRTGNAMRVSCDNVHLTIITPDGVEMPTYGKSDISDVVTALSMFEGAEV